MRRCAWRGRLISGQAARRRAGSEGKDGHV